MSYPKVGLYRKYATIQRKKHKMTNLDFDIVLYASEKEWFGQYDVIKDVTNSKGVVIKSLAYLVEKRFLKIARERYGTMPRKYVIALKGRNMVTDFKESLFRVRTHE